MDEDRTPEEEAEVEGHAHDPDPFSPDPLRSDDEDVEAHALRDPDPMDPDPMRGDDQAPDPI